MASLTKSAKSPAPAAGKKAKPAPAKPKQAPAPAPAKNQAPTKPQGKPGMTPMKAKRAAEGPSRSQPNEQEVDHEVLEFIRALDDYRKAMGRPFPSWSEVLHVLRQLGYRKVEPAAKS